MKEISTIINNSGDQDGDKVEDDGELLPPKDRIQTLDGQVWRITRIRIRIYPLHTILDHLGRWL